MIVLALFIMLANGQCASLPPQLLDLAKGELYCLPAGPSNPQSTSGNWSLNFLYQEEIPLSYSLTFGSPECTPNSAPFVNVVSGVNPTVVTATENFGTGNVSYILILCGTTGNQDSCQLTVSEMSTCTLPLNQMTLATTTTTTVSTTSTTAESTFRTGTTLMVNTTTNPATTSPADVFCDSDSGICVRNGETIFANGTVLVLGSIQVEQGGTLVIGSSVLTSTESINIGGTVEFEQCVDGKVEILAAPNVTVLSSGTFVPIQNCPCKSIALSSVETNAMSISVVLTVTDTCGTGGSNRLSTGAIVGIAVGSVAGAALLVLLIVLLSRRKERKETRIAMTNAHFINTGNT